MSNDQKVFTKLSKTSGNFSKEMERATTANETGNVPWLAQLKAFCSEASVVGLRYVANPSASVFRRSIWILLILIGAAFTTYQILNRTLYYLSHPTNVNIRVEHVPEMKFPSVTICSENMITLSGATSLGEDSCNYTLLRICVSFYFLVQNNLGLLTGDDILVQRKASLNVLSV